MSDSEESSSGDDAERRAPTASQAPAPPVTMLRPLRTSDQAQLVYYSKVRVGAETYSCGECVMMDTDTGGAPAEILYIFKDKHGCKWVENRWLYVKDEVEESIPRNRVLICSPPLAGAASRRPVIDDDELFETNYVGANPAEAILHKITVLDEGDYRRKVGLGIVGGHDRFCRWSFDTRLKRLIPAGEQAPAARLRRGRRFSDCLDAQAESDSDDDSIDGDQAARHAGSEDDSTRDSMSRPGKRPRVSTSSGAKRASDKFGVALDSLHVTAVPKSLPCREREREKLLTFLTSNIKSGGLGNSLFMAGMPGTGKTATAHEVLRVLTQQQARRELPSFALVELNGMRLVNPHQAYTQLWLALSGEMLGPKRALGKLDRYFSSSNPSRGFVVLLVDELDYMTTSKQTVLYNLFEWPSRPHARLVVVGIANTMDLPERCMPRISSRLTSRLTFPAYKKDQLVKILEGRLAEAHSSMGKVFDRSAVAMAAAKVAAASGDMRTCLKFCCRAIEEKSEVSVDDVRLAVREISQQAHLLAVRDSAPQERLLLVAICNEIHHGGKVAVEMDDVRARMEGICRAHPNGPRMPNVATILEMLSRLGDGQVLSLDLSRRSPMPEVQLNMTVRDVVRMLRDDVAFSRKVLPGALTAEYPPTSELPQHR